MRLRPRALLPRQRLLHAALAATVAGTVGWAAEQLGYHELRVDADGAIVSWAADDPGAAYDQVVRAVWEFWLHLAREENGLPYYMNHQVWRPDFPDPRGIGGDQFAMALSSWRWLYQYTGDERVKENQRFIADWYLAHSLSRPDCRWPNLPFPYNNSVYSGAYDGDMVLGAGFTQPDKAGSFGLELVHLYKETLTTRYPNRSPETYLAAARAIADCLAARTQPGDAEHSPLPFKVNVVTGKTGPLDPAAPDAALASYTTNWAPTLELFAELAAISPDRAAPYARAADSLLAWMKTFPMVTQRWGPFFEDVSGWSDTQINAMTWARYVMDHPEQFPHWQSDVTAIFGWVDHTLGNSRWRTWGVTAINEQTAYLVPGNSHTARQGADELLFCARSGDWSRRASAIRQLNWATYMVDADGKNRFPQDENWLTDGYGDYVRHYLRAMAVVPELAPADQNHLLSSTSILQDVSYTGSKYPTAPVRVVDPATVVIAYSAFDANGTEVLRLIGRPRRIFLGGAPLTETNAAGGSGYTWRPLPRGGVLTIRRRGGHRVIVAS